MKKIKLGIIGTGVAAKLLHWPALKKLGNCYEVCAVANRTVKKAEDFAVEIGLGPNNVYGDYSKLLERSDIDTVILALPTEMNLEVTLASMKAGKNVICEKPIAATVVDAEEMINASKKFGRYLLIAENFRYDKAVNECKRLLKEGLLSPPLMMMYKWMQHVPEDDEIASRPWRQDSGLPGGFLSDHGIHMLDVVRYLLGELKDIQVFGIDNANHVAGIDTALFNMKSENGDISSIQWSFSVQDNETSMIEIWASNGHLKLTPDKIHLKTNETDEIINIENKESSFYYQFLDFHEVIVNGKTPIMKTEDALKDLQLVFAAYESIISEKVIHLIGGVQR